MRFLVTNDDGIYAPGLKTLVSVLKEFGQVTVVCPDGQRSGYGHSISVSHPLSVEEVHLLPDVEAYHVNGTPADCVKLALEKLCHHRPDWLISGMNAGANVGQDVFYSGTIGAAREGALNGVASLAVSLARNEEGDLNFDQSMPILHHSLAKLLTLKIPTATFLNLNIPACPAAQVQGYRFAPLGLDEMKFSFKSYHDPKGRPVYWLRNLYQQLDSDQETDYGLLHQGFVTVSAVQVDTNHETLNHEFQRVFEP
ncbi:5'/3'-nucleotidase SurE [Vaginisenegalia massiliensis]|uniref:5'/3'-nucleotidase SurE n=1 Tax=Vaginisenegalia massiliensis TaxID=2058294 RepID=UPI0013DE472A|nr:5'/3'-nucleotidase SurE [Vaginisenegalia massiliensis]